MPPSVTSTLLLKASYPDQLYTFNTKSIKKFNTKKIKWKLFPCEENKCN
jgi:hypothetical protein